ncbi:unnamed protein product [Ectocarpus sp. CCAP 1310/34]|nr:unnamed protein product [Ectocarpus sp. CCAP 1310/34]
MTSWFTNGWLRLGSKKRGQQLGSKDENDKENEGWYPTNKKAKKTVKSAFAGAKPSNQGSWLLCQDREGRMYWWNDVTGQWTYQLYSSAQQQQQQQGQGYVQQQQQQQQHLLQQQQTQQMMPQMHHQMSYPQQQHSAAHLYNTSSHSLTRSASMSALGGASPQMYMAQHEPWGLVSPSTSTAMNHGASAAAASAVGGFGLGWASGLSSRGSGLSSRGSASSASAGGSGTRMSFFGLDDEDDDDEEYEQLQGAAAGSAWDKFFDGQGRPVWIHSRTGARTTIDPERTGLL